MTLTLTLTYWIESWIYRTDPQFFGRSVRVSVRVRVTKLVDQIGLTTFFRSQGRENILASKQAAAAAAASKQASSN